MRKYVNAYTASEEGLNMEIMNRTNDKPLYEYVVNICKSLEVINNIEFVGYTIETDESKIDVSAYIEAKKRRKDKEEFDYKYLQDTRVSEITLNFKLRCKDGIEDLQKKILLPKEDSNHNYTIKGKKYFLMYQLVDASTFTTQTDVVLKSFMRIDLKRVTNTFEDVDGNSYKAPLYTILLFRKDVNIFSVYFAKFGLSGTLKYFSMNSIMKLIPNLDEIDKEKNVYFKINSSLYIEVNKFMFNKYKYVKSIIAMTLNVCNNRVNEEIGNNKQYWIEKLGSLSTSSQQKAYAKGLTTLMFFKRMIDITTKNILKLHEHNKSGVYSSVRWLVQNYNDIRKKDNTDLETKRIRLNEYIANILNIEFSSRINRIVRDSKSTTLDDIKNLFKFPGDLIIQNLHTSGLLRYDDAVNDMNMFSKFKYTKKGPNSLGGKNGNTVNITQRGIGPSNLGRTDINVCGNSDPGTSGIITPYCEKIYGLNFSDKNEPEDFLCDFETSVTEAHGDDEGYVGIRYKDTNDYYAKQESFKDVAKELKVSQTYVLDEEAIFIYIDIDDQYEY